MGPDSRPVETSERWETSRELTTAIAALPIRYRAPVILRHVEGLSYREVALTLDQPVGAVKGNVHRGIKQLRESLESSALLASASPDGSKR